MSDANQVLEKLRADNKAAKLKPEDFYSKLIISTTRRRSLTFILCMAMVIFTSFIFRHLVAGSHWLMIAWPVSLVGFMIALFPATEEWLYKPWQLRARQYERHTTTK